LSKQSLLWMSVGKIQSVTVQVEALVEAEGLFLKYCHSYGAEVDVISLIGTTISSGKVQVTSPLWNHFWMKSPECTTQYLGR
jgi:hypothetical protein